MDMFEQFYQQATVLHYELGVMTNHGEGRLYHAVEAAEAYELLRGIFFKLCTPWDKDLIRAMFPRTHYTVLSDKNRMGESHFMDEVEFYLELDRQAMASEMSLVLDAEKHKAEVFTRNERVKDAEVRKEREARDLWERTCGHCGKVLPTVNGAQTHERLCKEKEGKRILKALGLPEEGQIWTVEWTYMSFYNDEEHRTSHPYLFNCLWRPQAKEGEQGTFRLNANNWRNFHWRLKAELEAKGLAAMAVKAEGPGSAP